MKKLLSFALAALLAVGLTACGNAQDQSADVDLTAYYDAMAEQQGWDDNYLAQMPDDMLDTYYPGLRDIETKQFIARASQMSTVVSEIVLMECGSAEDAQTAADILQQRADEQAEGGAWYPESLEAWKNAQVAVNGNYASLIVSGENQKELTDAYNALFAA